MKRHAETFPIEKMAQILKVSRSSYYTFLVQKPSKREEENEVLLSKIRSIYYESRQTYGSPRIFAELKKQGIQCSRPRVAKLMKEGKIRAKMNKAWKRTTKAKEGVPVAPNHLKQNFSTDQPNQIWISDITYIATLEGWLYLSVALDLYSRKVIGLSMGDHLQTSLVTKTLEQALLHRKPSKGLIHHSDRGCQYTSKDFKTLMDKYGILLSMSGSGHCYDNAVAESFFHTLKTEHTDFNRYRTREEAISSIFEYIEVFYNRKRLHSTLGYQTPEEYENLWSEKAFSSS